MNKHEVRGGVRYGFGKVETAVGDAVDSRDWQTTGVIDQVAGGAENLFGRAKAKGEELADMTPELIEEARERIEAAADRSAEVARRGVERARTVVEDNGAAAGAVGVLLAGAVGYALGWLVHGRR